MWKKILLLLAAALVAFLVVAGYQPAEFSVQRTTTVNAPPEAVFPHVNDLHKWDAWSPWAKLDPGMKTTHEGAAAGAGASYSWSGNSEVGEGRMTITESQPNSLIRIRLEFLKPFKAINTTEFTFKPEATSTVVTWTMSGTNNFMGKAFSLFMNMDKMVGGDFEKGLNQMKSVVEKPG